MKIEIRYESGITFYSLWYYLKLYNSNISFSLSDPCTLATYRCSDFKTALKCGVSKQLLSYKLVHFINAQE